MSFRNWVARVGRSFVARAFVLRSRSGDRRCDLSIFPAARIKQRRRNRGRKAGRARALPFTARAMLRIQLSLFTVIGTDNLISL